MPVGVDDPRSLLPAVQWETRKAFLELAKRFYRQTGHVLRVRSGRRTCAEQAEQVSMGFSHAAGCRSWHVLARAIDADPVRVATGKTIADSRVYAQAGAIWEAIGGRWGGRFIIAGYPDEGHFEWHPGLSIDQLCPDPNQCSAVAATVRTKGPATWFWMLGTFAAVVGVALWHDRGLRAEAQALARKFGSIA